MKICATLTQADGMPGVNDVAGATVVTNSDTSAISITTIITVGERERTTSCVLK